MRVRSLMIPSYSRPVGELGRFSTDSAIVILHGIILLDIPAPARQTPHATHHHSSFFTLLLSVIASAPPQAEVLVYFSSSCHHHPRRYLPSRANESSNYDCSRIERPNASVISVALSTSFAQSWISKVSALLQMHKIHKVLQW